MAVARDPWVASAPTDHEGAALFAACASCHMADGSGRPDGSVPRLAGQREAIVVAKLDRLRRGEVYLPLMIPFARAMTDADVHKIARYVAALPETPTASTEGQGADLYAATCAACHGRSAEGDDARLAPRLCGQHAPYVLRRMQETIDDRRGDADPAMAAIVSSLDEAQRATIAAWLAAGSCAPEAGS